jgi:hypothetical protein
VARISATAYAAHRRQIGLQGQTQPAVSQAIRDGRLTEPAVEWDGRQWRIDPELADQQWAGATSSHQKYLAGRGGRPSPKPLPDPAEPPDPADPAEPPDPPAPPQPRQRARSFSPGGSLSQTTKAEAERQAAIVKAERLKLALKKDLEQVGLIEDMKREAAKVATQVRDAMLLIADRLPPRLVNLNDVHEVREILLSEIEIALRNFA